MRTRHLAIESKAFSRQINAFLTDWSLVSHKNGTPLVITQDATLGEEEYQLEVGDKIWLRAKTNTGAAWGLQTLGQLLASKAGKTHVKDHPDTNFRTVMLDVARRYHSPSTLRQLIRYCQLGKVRYVQLHLTDDQNWMLPSSQLKGIDRFNQHEKPAYTPAELTDLQTYATDRGVTIIPEIDLPGHSTILCKYDPATFQIEGSASKNCINFASTKTKKVVREVLGEIAKLFPASPYIHLGGDEAWYPDAEKDPAFAALIAKNKSVNPHTIFVDFVAEMSRTVTKLGKTPIVWEGFGPGDGAKQKLPKSTIVMAWEGDYYPAKQLVADGFRVVNAGWDPHYVVNHFPYDSFTLVPLPRLYSHDPGEFGVVNWPGGKSRAVKLDGKLEGSMMCWWEGHEWHAQRILPPRILAFGSRLWNREAEQNYPHFLARMQFWHQQLERSFYPFFVNREEGSVGLTNTQIRIESTPLHGGVVTAMQAYKGKEPVGEVAFVRTQRTTVVQNLALKAKVTASTPEDPQFPASLITDGISDDIASFWLGYPNPTSVTIDLGEPKQLNRVDVVPFYASRQAMQYRVWVGTDPEGTLVADASKQSETPTVNGYAHQFNTRSARYIRIEILGSQQFPSTVARLHEVRAFLESK
jgi:hexosaminidase